MRSEEIDELTQRLEALRLHGQPSLFLDLGHQSGHPPLLLLHRQVRPARQRIESQDLFRRELARLGFFAP